MIWKSYKGLEGNQWETYLADEKKNGRFCMCCAERFRQKYNALLCSTCISSMVVGLSKRYAHYVYGLYLDGALVYVGVTKDLEGRMQAHLAEKDVDEMRAIKGFSSRVKAEEFETMCIDGVQPPLNKTRTAPKRDVPWQWLKMIVSLKEAM